MKTKIQFLNFIKPDKKTILAYSVIFVWSLVFGMRPLHIFILSLIVYPVIRYLFCDSPAETIQHKDLKILSWFIFNTAYILISLFYLFPEVIQKYFSGIRDYGDTNFIRQTTIIIMIISGWTTLLFGYKAGGIVPTVFVSLVYIANHSMYRIRERFISVDDFYYLSTAAKYGKEYKLIVWQDIIYLISVTIILILYLKAVDKFSSGIEESYIKKNKILLINTALATFSLYTFFTIYTPEPISYFVRSCKLSLHNMSTENIDRYSKTYSVLGDTVNKPNIIFVLNEAYADLEYTYNDETFKSHYDTLNKIKNESCVSGYIYSDEIGGGTVNTEFSALTGVSSKITATGGYIYQNYTEEEIISLPAILKQSGYYTIGINSATMDGYNRRNAWRMYDFDKIICKDDIEVTDQLRSVGMDDYVLYDVALDNIKETEAPTFQYLVTIQNHGPYDDDDDKSDIEEYLDYEDYSTEQLLSFIENLKETEEPTILVFFGDHTPSLSRSKDDDSNDIDLLHQVPFFIWSNYETGYEPTDVGVTSPNYLGMFTCEIIGAHNEWYDDMSGLYKQYPLLIFKDEDNKNDITKEFYLSDESTEEYKRYVYSCLNMLLK